MDKHLTKDEALAKVKKMLDTSCIKVCTIQIGKYLVHKNGDEYTVIQVST